MVRTELGEAPGLRIVPSGRIAEILGDLRIQPNANIDDGTLDRVSSSPAPSSSSPGSTRDSATAIRLEASLRGTSGSTVPLTAEAATDGDIPVAVKALVQSLREEHLGCTGAAVRHRSTLPGPKSSSMAALKAYSEGEQLARENKSKEALASDSKRRLKRIPTFALAFAKLAQTHHAMGYGEQAEQVVRKAAVAE